jgi:hypothetical protein
MFAERTLNAVPWGILVLLCLTVGLAPFRPPHLVTKTRMLLAGRLVRPLDWVDFLVHLSPWILLVAKTGMTLERILGAS